MSEQANDRLVISRDGGRQVSDIHTSQLSTTIQMDTTGFAPGDPVRIDASGDLQLASSTAFATMEVMGIVSNTANVVIVAGEAPASGLTPGSRTYLGDGIVSHTVPTLDDHWVVLMGYAKSATVLIVGIQEIAGL